MAGSTGEAWDRREGRQIREEAAPRLACFGCSENQDFLRAAGRVVANAADNLRHLLPGSAE